MPLPGGRVKLECFAIHDKRPSETRVAMAGQFGSTAEELGKTCRQVSRRDDGDDELPYSPAREEGARRWRSWHMYMYILQREGGEGQANARAGRRA